MHSSGEHHTDRGSPQSLLDDRAIEAIARRVMQLLQEHTAVSERSLLVTAAEIARRYGVSRQWVYENADRLGAVRLGRGARPRLRFDPGHVESQLRSARKRSESAAGTGAADESGSDAADLIPIRRL
jgi:hypothetical protein